MLCYSIAIELNDLLAHVWVTSIDGPGCVAIVAGNIDLRSGHRAVKRGSLTFIGLQERSFGEVDCVNCFNDTGNAVRRFRDGQ